MEERKTIKVGVFGIGRGSTYMALNYEPLNMELVAICDKNEPRLEEQKKIRKVAAYTDFDEFIKHPGMEAVFLANYFHEHAPYAIKALKAGLHVYSECGAIGTLKDGVELCEAVEQSGKVYMFGENHGFSRAGLEMKKLYDAGEIGEVMYAEGEYNHPSTGRSPTRWPLVDGPDHWRLWLAPTYYCTHAMGPLMYVTGQQPVSVNARSIRLADVNAHTMGIFKGCRDNGAVSLVTMENGAVCRIFGTGIPGHSNSYRYHGTRGAMEMVHGPGYFGPGALRVWHEPLHLTEGMVGDRTYYPEWPAFPAQANKSGHQGADFWANYFFAEAIRTGCKPVFDVYDGCAMSAVGICGWKSVLQGGGEVEIPNFRDKVAREKYRDDNFCPVHTYEGSQWVPNTTRPGVTLEEQIRLTNECYEYNVPYYSTQPIKH
ncbi:MAG: Gfo/Idh/MocA family oxidoreductase [Ruminococcaceae bacterium]|nr:Gfo/Idh/MocA family oxidoreductase [Oscillospiraceae bacterium]